MKPRFNLIAYLPASLRFFLRQRFEEAAGIVLIGASLVILLALLSWHQGDPSFNNSTGLAPQNWMGVPGAFTADIMLQTLGLGTLAFLLPLVIWGVRLFAHEESSRPVARVAAWLGGTLVATIFFGALPIVKFWALAPHLGFGGALGDRLSDLSAGTITPFLGDGLSYFLLALISAPIAAWLVLFASDLSFKDAADFSRRLMVWRRVAPKKQSAVAYPLQTRRRQGAAPLAVEEAQPSRLQLLLTSITASLTDLRQRFLGGKDTGPSLDELRARDPFSRTQAAGETEFDDDEEEGDDEEEVAPRPRGLASSRSDAAAQRVHRTAPKPTKTSKRAAREAQPRLNLERDSDYELPPLSLLSKPKPTSYAQQLSDDALEANARILESVLDDFGIKGTIANVSPGPVVTLYELEPAPGIKSSRVIALADDIARSMSAVSARVAVVPGRNVIGIELPNARREMVYLRELLESPDYENSSSKLALALGKNIGGESVISDLARMPHLLIAGTTGSGKSVGINTMILSLLYRLTPEQCKLIMIDPKMLELSVYDGIPHLIAPVVTEPKKAIVALKWVVKEMEDRYRKMSKVGVRNIDGYNVRVIEAQEKGEVLVRTVQTGFDRETGKAIYEEEEMDLDPMPFIVVIVDEMADLMMVAGKEIEAAIQRLAQMARAAGIHIITATQRPSVDVITGTIKANFPTRISFQVTSKIDSRTILGEQGAEQLLGQGDMLYMAGGGRIRRVHGPFVSDEEVEKVVSFLKKQGIPEYLEAITAEPDEEGGDGLSFGEEGTGDDLYDKAVAIVARDKRASTSYIQRRLQIGYNRAARLIELMEEQGVISTPNHQGKREVLIGEPGDGVRY